MRAFHEFWWFVVIATNLLAGIWGLVLGARRRSPRAPYWAAVLTGQAALALQVVVGVILFQETRPPGQHVFYGFMLLFVAVASWAFRGGSPRRAAVVTGGVATFVGIVAVRAGLTA